MGQRLQKQGALADPRIAPEEDDASRDQAAAKHAVEFTQPGWKAREVIERDLRQRPRAAQVTRCPAPTCAPTCEPNR